ncbi:MBL fold metallo-hydrolase [Cellulomonas marina]|uniref:Glyoxylase, beta-lactamase superfamily II n=1 Tax=Cellulomonas marina TaxID=988821 RepID=A0A1I0W7L5_9CELL|nr:MBL fold metallo-hydrolase [Cellulomonas marina]SFA84260.1 Glyoxylase, beta-lactamase superfamily II [Cellulomonas marina]
MPGLRLLELVAPVLGARCVLLVAEDGSCVAVDVGAGVADRVARVVADRGWTPQAVLATHGHVDHTWGAGELSRTWDVPVVLHAADAYRLDDPFGTLGVLGHAAHAADGPLAGALRAAGVDPADYRRPERVETFGTAGGVRSPVTAPATAPDLALATAPDLALAFGGVHLVARHAPGHTQGSTLLLLDALVGQGDRVNDGVGGDRSPTTVPVALTGDVLFAGSVGRTDLPGGDGATMARTLREVVATLDPATLVVPGHGPTSTVAAELATNPYLTPPR